ncbi:MAG: PDZ domain-containing protein [Crocinitomicaceae bacterium]|jgi:predicted metalloprotease with PDZ domain|nr:PDZ domain-containing protein [Crocinitomicaceae bacterium]
MRYYLTVLAILNVFAFALFSQEVHYDVRMEKPENHYFQVDMTVSNWKDKTLEVKLPVWAPGSYLVREFSKNLNQVHAKNEKGERLPIQKTAKNTWLIESNNSKSIHISYEVYSFELTVRTSFLDNTHGFISGSGVFMYVEKLKNKAGTLTVHKHKSFKHVSTALSRKSEGVQGDSGETFTFKDYDQLVDCPIEIGNQVLFDFEAAGVKHTVAMYGDGNYDIPTLQKDMANIVENATKVFGENPNKEYLFIVHNVVNGQGGLEHKNSTTLSVNRWTYQGAEYLGFLSLVAHEYFHLWNVKRIRPIELGPFNYDEENYTTLLWVMEGFTSYYDELLMLRAGYYTQEQYISKLNGSLNYVEGTPGSRVQPLSHSSYDAWIKAYRPNENSANTTMTYYTRGQMMAAIFDAMIIYESKGKNSLDNFLQALYQKYYKKENRGFTNAEFKAELEQWTKQDLTEFWANYIDGTEMPDYNVYFSRVGIEAEYIGQKQPTFGARFSDNGGTTVVRYVRSNSTAENAGLSVDDEIIAVDGFRVDSGDLNELLSSLNEGDTFTLLVSRDKVLMDLKVTMESYEQPRFRLSFKTSSKEKMLRDFWLR